MPSRWALPLLLLSIHSLSLSNAFASRYPFTSQYWQTRRSTSTSSDECGYVDIPPDLNNTVPPDNPTTQFLETENPMWPNGVSIQDIDELVDDILADDSINLPQLPDFLERQIYKTTTLLTLNAAYRLIGWVHGKRLWGHKFALTRLRCDDLYRRTRQKSLLHMKTDVDEELLEQVADQLLDNCAINQPLVPDVIERQLYVNCLKIIFRILNMLAASFRITLCGHDLTLNLEKAMDRESLRKVARTAASSETLIDTAVLQEVVRASESLEEDTPLWKRGQREFVVQVNTVLYSLILGILDDLLANTELEVMTDRIRVDILPPSQEYVVERTERRIRVKKVVRKPGRRRKKNDSDISFGCWNLACYWEVSFVREGEQ